jgi:hypothetical protein
MLGLHPHDCVRSYLIPKALSTPQSGVKFPPRGAWLRVLDSSVGLGTNPTPTLVLCPAEAAAR